MEQRSLLSRGTGSLCYGRTHDLVSWKKRGERAGEREKVLVNKKFKSCPLGSPMLELLMLLLAAGLGG